MTPYDIVQAVVLVAAAYGVFASYRGAYNAGVRRGLALAVKPKGVKTPRPAAKPPAPLVFATQADLSKALADELNKKTPDSARLDQLIALNNANRKNGHVN